MPVQRITKRVVDALQAGESDRFVWDSDLTGFGVKVTPRGTKTYVIQYRVPGTGRNGTAKRMVLGAHGRLTTEEARRLARRHLGTVAQGSDPVLERALKREAKTVAEVSNDYLDDASARLKPVTLREYRRLLLKHVLPTIGNRPIQDVQASDIRRLHRSMAATPFIANRVVAMLGGFFTFAIEHGFSSADRNPAHGIEFYPEPPRERFLTPEEFRRLGDALTQAETVGLPAAPIDRRKPKKPELQKHRPKLADEPIPANPFAVAAIRLITLTGCRRNEILALRRDELDLERGYLRLRDSKSGRSVRAIGGAAVALLRSLPHVDGQPFVLPGTRGQHLKNIKRVWNAVRFAAKLGDVRLHDLRHSYASVPATSGDSLLVIRSLLGHKRASTTERYAHLGDDPVKSAAERTSTSIAAWMQGNKD